MTSSLAKQLLSLDFSTLCDLATKSRFMARIKAGNLTKAKNRESHFGVHFLPVNSKAKQVFLVHHKKANLWIAPGGHIDKDETLHQTLIREAREELGLMIDQDKIIDPFLASIKDILNPLYSCRRHYDIWYAIETDGKNFQIDLKEFHETSWVSIEEAKKLITDPNNLAALEKIARNWT